MIDTYIARHTLSLVSLLLVMSVALSPFASAQDSTRQKVRTVPSATEPPPDAALIGRWIAELESPSQASRSAAQASLQRTGAAAIEQVAAAARSPNPEVRLRCMEILRRHAGGEEPALAEQSKETLQRLAGDGDMGVARAAESAIAANARSQAAKVAADVTQQHRMVVRGGAMIRLRPMVAARAVAVPAVARSVNISIFNGKRTINAKDGDEEVEISDGGEDGITMSISKKSDGKVEKKTYAAKDADELKEKHADAFKIYEQYAKDGGVGAVRKELRRARPVVPEPGVEVDGKAKPAPKLPPVNHTDVPKAAAPLKR
jgi:hypothetical protein